MRRKLTIAALLGMMSVICVGQQGSHKLSEYVGTWQAEFHGTPFITINLAEKSGQLTGSASFGDIHADPSGVITAVEAPTDESPIVNSRVLPSGGVELTSRGEDADDTITVVLHLVDGKTGSIRFGIAMGRDAMAVRPITVKRIESKS